MKQMNVDPESLVNIDFTTPETERTLKILQPVVYKDGDAFGCLLGEDPTVGIFGCGNSADEAISDWKDNLKSRINEHQENDELADFVIDSLSITKDDVW